MPTHPFILADLSCQPIEVLTHPLQGSRPPAGPVKEAKSAGHVATPEQPESRQLEKIYLHWVTKHRAMLEWFQQQMSDFSDVGLSGADVSTTLNRCEEAPLWTRIQLITYCIWLRFTFPPAKLMWATSPSIGW